jgi:hypothetical protein
MTTTTRAINQIHTTGLNLIHAIAIMIIDTAHHNINDIIHVQNQMMFPSIGITAQSVASKLNNIANPMIIRSVHSHLIIHVIILFDSIACWYISCEDRFHSLIIEMESQACV